MQALLELMRRSSMGFPKQVRSLTLEEDLAAAQAVLPALSLPAVMSQSINWAVVRAAWQEFVSATDNVMDAEPGSPEAFFLNIRRMMLKAPVGVVLFYLIALGRAVANEQSNVGSY